MKEEEPKKPETHNKPKPKPPKNTKPDLGTEINKGNNVPENKKSNPKKTK